MASAAVIFNEAYSHDLHFKSSYKEVMVNAFSYYHCSSCISSRESKFKA